MIFSLNMSENDYDLSVYSDYKELICSTKIQIPIRQSEMLLVEIDNFLKGNNIKKLSLKAIICITGTDSYTGIRIGLTTANFLAFSLGIPIFRNLGETNISSRFFNGGLSPCYAQAPRITESKKRTGRK